MFSIIYEIQLALCVVVREGVATPLCVRAKVEPGSMVASSYAGMVERHALVVRRQASSEGCKQETLF